ncbi:MAG: hypothetical protein ACK58M_01040, partial [Acidobacteriota bacterium]
QGPISRRNQQIGDHAAVEDRPNIGSAAAGRKQFLSGTGLRRLAERTHLNPGMRGLGQMLKSLRFLMTVNSRFRVMPYGTSFHVVLDFASD